MRVRTSQSSSINLNINSNFSSGYIVSSQYTSAGGSLAVATSIILTIASGVFVYVTSAGNPISISPSVFAAGTTLLIINNGTIIGIGGDGGNGHPGSSSLHAPNGSAGGDAIVYTTTSTNLTVTIDNTSGYILGAGGGGAGGDGDPFYLAGGGGGGGGRGFPGGFQGLGGANNGGDGTAGDYTTGAGAAGAGGVFGLGLGGDGGNGGDFGSAGSPGHLPSGANQSAGGAAGYAIRKNGNATPTWLGGNNGSQVKGLVA